MRIAAAILSTAAVPVGLSLLIDLAMGYATDGTGLHPGLAVGLSAAMSACYVAGCFLLLGSRR